MLRARAYLLRVAEPPAPALVWLVAAVGPVEAAARVRAGAVPEEVARETAARRAVDRVDDDLAARPACGGRLLTPEHPAWPHWAFAALDNVAYGPGAGRWLGAARRVRVHGCRGNGEDEPDGAAATAVVVSAPAAGSGVARRAAVAGRSGGAGGAGMGAWRGGTAVVWGVARRETAAWRWRAWRRRRGDGGCGGGRRIARQAAAVLLVAAMPWQWLRWRSGAAAVAARARRVPRQSGGSRRRRHAAVAAWTGWRWDGGLARAAAPGPVGADAPARTRGDLAPPIALWVRGSGALAELCDQAAAIVGARAATGYGLHMAGELGAGLAAAGFTVVSGAAIGIDGAAHRGALAAAGPTVAVLACGVDRSYPAAHEALLERIAADRAGGVGVPARIRARPASIPGPQPAHRGPRGRHGRGGGRAAQRRPAHGRRRPRARPTGDGRAGPGHLRPLRGLSPA